MEAFYPAVLSIFLIDPVAIILFACSHLIRLASCKDIHQSICAKMNDHIQGRRSLLKLKSQMESRCRCSPNLEWATENMVLISLHLWI